MAFTAFMLAVNIAMVLLSAFMLKFSIDHAQAGFMVLWMILLPLNLGFAILNGMQLFG